MSELTVQQKAFFESLMESKKFYTNQAIDNLIHRDETMFEEEYQLLNNKLSSDKEITAFKKAVSEIIVSSIFAVLATIDEPDNSLSLDLIDRRTNKPLLAERYLYEAFIEYLNLEEE